jgi:hypothetical protein
MNAIIRTFFPFFQMESGENTKPKVDNVSNSRAVNSAQMKHQDFKRINELRLKVENMQLTHAKFYMRDPGCKECQDLRADIADYKKQIEEIESRYPDWKM